MKILLVTATTLEVKSLLPMLRKEENTDLLITGVGGVATAYSLTKKLTTDRYDLLIQAGIAGSFNTAYAPGSTVVVASEYFGDVCVMEEGKRKSIFDLGLASSDKKPFTNGWLQNPNARYLKSTGLPAVKSVSVNEITTNKKTITYFKKELDAGIESMEGAAFHYVAILEKIPFIQIRAISNYVGERDKEKWGMKEAINGLSNAVTTILFQ